MDKLVLWAMADAHNTAKGCTYPSIAAVMDFTGWQRRAVISGLARLAAAGMLIDTRDRIGKTRQVKVWRFPFDPPRVQEMHPLPRRKSALTNTLSDD